MSEAQVPAIANLRECPFPRGCGNHYPNSRKHFANTDTNRVRYCIECTARHAEEDKENAKRNIELALQKKVNRILGDGTKEIDLPTLRQLGAAIIGVYGGVEKYAEAFQRDYDQTDDPAKRAQYHKLAMRALEQAHKHELNERTAAAMSDAEIEAEITRIASQGVLDAHPAALAQMLGVEKLQEALDFAKQEQRIVDEVTQG
jgi:hypothetical protein